MDDISSIVIIGGGEAGFNAARTLREQGYPGVLTVVGAEPQVPYHRPPLSKGYLQGGQPLDDVLFESAGWYAGQGIDLRTGVEAVSLDRAAAQLGLSDGSRVRYDRLLLATGSRARSLPLPGADLPGVVSLRTVADADDLREAIAAAGRVVLIGGGWIGLEIASAARLAGREVTVLEAADLPLQRVLGTEVAQVFADLHTAHGVDLRCGVSVARLVGGDRVTGVELADGSLVPADLVVVGVGAAPNVELAAAAGLPVDNGIVVDEFLRTEDPAVWAAGDVAAAWHPTIGRRIRVEHAQNASHQGRAAALSMLGRGSAYDEQPFFYTDQYDLGMEYVGYTEPDGYDRVVLRGDVAGLRFMAFWLSEGRVLAGMHVNTWDATGPITELVSGGRTVDADRLADADVPLPEV